MLFVNILQAFKFLNEFWLDNIIETKVTASNLCGDLSKPTE